MFDAEHYARQAGAAAPADPEAARAHYLAHGQAAGYSPNRWIDEAWLRATLPGGASGFDALCRAGTVRAPHWLFDQALYRHRYPDLTDEALEAGGFRDGFDHYLRVGDREGRSGSPFLDPAFTLARLPPVAAAHVAARGCFAWYLEVLGTVAEPDLSPWFDPAWYLAHTPQARRAPGALRHYLTAADPGDPLPQFSERFYLDRYPDIAAAVAAGTWRSGYQHFLFHGAFELRQPSAALDLAQYMATDPAVAEDLARGRVREAFSHYLQTAGPNPAPAPDVRAEVRALLPGRVRAKLDFTPAGPPALSVVFAPRGGFAETLAALAALHADAAGRAELILIETGAGDETGLVARYLRGATVLDFGRDLGPVAVVNAGLACAAAPLLLVLDGGVALVSGAVDAVLARFAAEDPPAALIGRLLAEDGRVIEAGRILWRDGALAPYMAGASGLAPEVCFRRRVTGGSLGLLALRREVVEAAGGLAVDFADPPAPGAALADLLLRLEASAEYDPALAGRVLTPLAEEASGAERLRARHPDALAARPARDPARALFARAPGARRILVIEDTPPLRRAGSGFVRSAELVAAMARLGCAVSVMGMARGGFELGALFADLPDTVELLHDRSADTLPALLAERAGFYDVVWIARAHNLRRLLPFLTGLPSPPRLILDTEAIAALREAEQARLTGAAFDLPGALAGEFAGAAACAGLVAVSAAEAEILRGLGLGPVTVIGHSRRPTPSARGFAERSGLLFLGAMHEPDSPNHDALRWFVAEVLPRVEQALRWETRLTVAGFTGPGVDLSALAGHARITLRGAVAETAPLFDQHRVFVAPTRFAAGLPYKLHEAAGCGLPIVASGLLARQLGWDDALLAAEADDPAGFAEAVVRLYRDPALWERLRAAALARMAAECDPARTEAALRSLLDLLE